jgi:uncharacterized membrane protein
VKIKTLLIDASKIINFNKNFPDKWENITAVKLTDIFGFDRHDDFITISRETWKRIELFMAILSNSDLSISEEKLNEIFRRDSMRDSNEGEKNA